MRLARQVAIITGAARGIGKAIALALVKEGAAVVLSDVSEDVHKVAAEIKQSGGQAVSMVGDVTKQADCEAMVDLAIKTFERLDILVNNAGITKDNLLMRMSEADWNVARFLILISKEHFYAPKPAIKPMMKQRSGK